MIDRLGFGVGLLLAPTRTHKNNVAAGEVNIDHVVKNLLAHLLVVPFIPLQLE